MVALRDGKRIVFMGTPQFALPSLQAVLAGGQHLVGVYTQGDKPSGRGGVPTPPLVKQRALEVGLPVFQPPSLRREEARRELAELKPDLIVVVVDASQLSRQLVLVKQLMDTGAKLVVAGKKRLQEVRAFAD